MITYLRIIDFLSQDQNIFTDKIITQATNNGGAVTYQVSDVILFIFSNDFTQEIEFIEYLIKMEKITQIIIESLFKHLLFETKIALEFVAWQRDSMGFVSHKAI